MHLQLYVLEDVTTSDRWRNEAAFLEILSDFFFGARVMHVMHVLRDIILFPPRLFTSSCRLSIFHIPLCIEYILASADSFSAQSSCLRRSDNEK